MTTTFEQNCFNTSSTLARFSAEASENLTAASSLLVQAFIEHRKLLICGNGGSAADSQHIAAEFVSSYSKNIVRKGLPAIALTTDTSMITAYANDFGYENVFARQVDAIGQKGDVLLVISTSGNSISCMRALEACRNREMRSIGLLGSGGKLENFVDIPIIVPSRDTQIIQQCHIVAYHSLVELVETSLFGA
jgi:D-sedoheptulose 7-phosphate isomerase